VRARRIAHMASSCCPSSCGASSVLLSSCLLVHQQRRRQQHLHLSLSSASALILERSNRSPDDTASAFSANYRARNKLLPARAHESRPNVNHKSREQMDANNVSLPLTIGALRSGMLPRHGPGNARTHVVMALPRRTGRGREKRCDGR
jgi:hypothetical protein